MLRRTIALALAGLAIAAPPALAHSHWNSQMKDASATASRSSGGCTIRPGWRHGSLLVTCHSRHTATFVYAFPVSRSGHVKGTPTSGVSWWGHAEVHRSVKVAGDVLRVTVRVTGGTAQLYSVSVGYYA
jgi:hypothetical protein